MGTEPRLIGPDGELLVEFQRPTRSNSFPRYLLPGLVLVCGLVSFGAALVWGTPPSAWYQPIQRESQERAGGCQQIMVTGTVTNTGANWTVEGSASAHVYISAVFTDTGEYFLYLPVNPYFEPYQLRLVDSDQQPLSDVFSLVRQTPQTCVLKIDYVPAGNE
jgi:hypothetical protein